MSQVSRIVSLLQDRLIAFDPTLDVSPGSSVYNAVISPVANALTPDPIDTDSLEFLKTRLSQEYPSLSAQDSDTVVSFLIKPLSLLMEPLKAELAAVKLGQSTTNAQDMTSDQAKDHAANWFVKPKSGGKSQTVVRVNFAAPQNVQIDNSVRFTTDGGLQFIPIRAQVIRIESMLVQREGSSYYIDVPVIAENEGAEYNVEASAIRRSTSFANSTGIRNLYAAVGGVSSETPQQLLTRVEQSLTERSLTSRRGIVARLFDEFGAQIRNLEVVGAGDPEMRRDIITGGGEGAVVASGISLIVGNYCLLISLFEDRGVTGARRVEPGNEIELNFWSFLYNVGPAESNQKFRVEQILLDTREAMTSIPSIVLMTLDRSPSVAPPVAATVPGSYPGVFAVVRGAPVIEISNIPGGIGITNTPRGTIEIDNQEIHVFGHNDIYVRPATEISATDEIVLEGVEVLFEGTNLSVALTENSTSGAYFTVSTTKVLTVSVAGPALSLGDVLRSTITNEGVATVLGFAPTPNTIYVSQIFGGDLFGNEVQVGSSYGTLAGSVVTVLSLSSNPIPSELFEREGVLDRLCLQIVRGPNVGLYRIGGVFGECISLLSSLSSLEPNMSFRIYREIQNDVVDPRRTIHPFMGPTPLGLQTTIGAKTVKVETDIRGLGAAAGDIFEILDGADKGVYRIEGFDQTYGGLAPILSSAMLASNSQVPYRVYRDLGGLQPPFVRIVPGGVKLLDSSSIDTGSTIPYALPVSARFQNGVAGARVIEAGKAGFVLPDPGLTWVPTGDVTAAASTFADKIACYSIGCEPCNGYIAVISMTDTGDVYLDTALPVSAIQFFTDLKNWVLDIINTLGLGTDFELFVQSFTPFQLASPPVGSVLVWQEEVCLPKELFDGRANIFVALPNIDWQAAFDSADSFQEVLSAYINGLLPDSFTAGARPQILDAVPGDSLTLPSGSNRGSYVIDAVHHFRLPVLGSIVSGQVDQDRLYHIGLVVVRDVFPAPPAEGLSEFFAAGIPTLTVPAPPAFTVSVFDNAGNPISPWETVTQTLTFLFQWANSLGFNAPDAWALDGGETLRQIWNSLTLPYSYGKASTVQTLRLWFQEPTSIDVFAPSPRREVYPLAFMFADTPSLESAVLTLPDAAFASAAYTFWVKDIDGTLTEYSGTLPAGAGSAANLAALRGFFEGALSSTPINVGEDSGKLTFTVNAQNVGTGAHQYFAKLDVYLEADDTTAAIIALGMTTFSASGQGTSVVLNQGTFYARPPTRFVGTNQEQPVEYVPAPSSLRIWPSTQGSTVAPSDYSRDMYISSLYQGLQQIGIEQNLTLPTWRRNPTRGVDWLRVYEQRVLLAPSVPAGSIYFMPDRSVGVTTIAGSPVLSLPTKISSLYTFTAPSSGDDADAVEVGDLVYIEEGESTGGYRVISRTATTLTLDRPVSSSTNKILVSGVDGVIDVDVSDTQVSIPAPSGAVNSNSLVGRYITLWGANSPTVDGCYKIDAVTNLGSRVVLDLDMVVPFFVKTEVNLQWAIIDPPSNTLLPSSMISGRTQLFGVVPIRIYNGLAHEEQIQFVAPLLDNKDSLFILHPESAIRRGVKQPYELIRKDWLGISSTEMQEQGRISGLYYFDVPVVSLGHTPEHNVARDFRVDAKFGSYSSDGYWFSVRDPNLSFSPREATDLVFSAYFLPAGQAPVSGNKVPLVTKTVRVSYEYAPLLDQIQTLLTSDTDRNICSETLVRHFLPSYIYLDARYTGDADGSAIATGMSSLINSLEPTQSISVSELESVFATNRIKNYSHPITIISLSHDWDRRIVESRSMDKLDDANLAFNGTNRTTFYIPGPDRSSATSEATIPDGERIYITQGVLTSSR
jgi:hypothetical protein